ncbi:MAG: LCP family protein [Candidatus Margulisbacteria bacterium]|nr:LCP family protein [Candidatus Margulisiibacteriota bacterium]MBU1022296.1 LCP family protein [Candidatus Margulisiibacteriota bacterium]MBU1729909.1 LCP family protein [Candidatus Margulisiibacteriota bacterium]MBU1955942.1 LCP family protein [Candidatus Margulisiibacteriota bacterium]
MNKKRKIDFLRILALLFVVFGVLYFYLYLFSPASIPGLLLLGIPNRQENILIIGSDVLFDAETKSFKEDGFGNSDTLIFASVNPFKKKINIISIPRDTWVNIRNYGSKKINAAYLIGGPNFTETTIADNFGIHSSGYVSLHLNVISEIVDAIGGVKIYVDKDMYYKDRRGGVFINLKEGEQVLNGEEAANFLRYRLDALGDVARIRRQQRFLKTLVNQMINPKNITVIPKLLPIIVHHTKTNLPPGRLVKLLNLTRTLDVADVNFYTLPGNFGETENGISIWQVNTAEANALFEEIL